jgi:prevent-host-death family protein
VRELKDQASEVLRRVREEAAQYVVTVRGEQQAVLRPLEEADMKHLEQREARAALTRLDGIARRVAREWAAAETAAELLAADRR